MTDLPPRASNDFCLSANVDYHPDQYFIPRQRSDWRHVQFESTAKRQKTWLEIANWIGFAVFLATVGFACFAH